MRLSLVQYRDAAGVRGVAAIRDDTVARAVPGADSVRALALAAIAAQQSLADAVTAAGAGDVVDLDAVTLLPPIDHEDGAHLAMTGTGLTHLGSAEGRDKMHRAAKADDAPTDSMKMFLMGVEGGKPAAGAEGVQPEWFYKGDGSQLVAPGAPLLSPAFALDAGEEPEIAGIYLIDADGTPVRLGFALANEFSDHVTERGNYLWLAHSKLRPAALGPELLVGDLPDDVRGTSRIVRDGATIWEKPFLSGEANMSHSIANLEHHHFKYGLFRRPGDVHVHFFGTATLSFAEGVQTQEGDVFEVEAAPFTLPVRNPIAVAAPAPVAIKVLLTMATRIAIVGLGKIARDQHLPVITASPDFELVAIASRSAGLPDLPHFESIEALLASDVAVDAVSLCQPPQVRYDAAKAAIIAGKHVFLEKPPGATLSEVEALADLARAHGVSLFASWHSRYASGVEAAKAWIAARTLRSVSVEWKEDVRVWHPGQTWIWEAGGLGVFDPGINALSIVTHILPRPFFLLDGTLNFPSNCQSAIAADLSFRDEAGVPIHAVFDFLQTGPQTWDIRVEAEDGELLLSKGGSVLTIDGVVQDTAPEAEYRGLYDRFAALVADGASDVDVAPLRHVADAYLRGQRVMVEPFVE